ncbi:MAG TPA: TonB family protein [Stenomitos sp.]
MTTGESKAYWAIAASALLHGGLFWLAQHMLSVVDPPRVIPVVLRVVPKPHHASRQPAKAPPVRPQPMQKSPPKRLEAHVEPLVPGTAVRPVAEATSSEVLPAPMEASDSTPVAVAAASASTDAAPSGGEVASTDAAVVSYETYLAELLAQIEGHVEYPLQARRMRWTGQCLLHCIVARDGGVHGVTLESSSGYRLLDAAAMRAVERVGRFPPLPEALGAETVILSIPVTFRLEN